jgi:hypothetical protein
VNCYNAGDYHPIAYNKLSPEDAKALAHVGTANAR